jgi:hypothetical protein
MAGAQLFFSRWLMCIIFAVFLPVHASLSLFFFPLVYWLMLAADKSPSSVYVWPPANILIARREKMTPKCLSAFAWHALSEK